MNEELINKVIEILNQRGSHDWNRLSREDKERIVREHILTDEFLNEIMQ